MLRSNKTDVWPENTVQQQIYHYGEFPSNGLFQKTITVNRCLFWFLVIFSIAAFLTAAIGIPIAALQKGLNQLDPHFWNITQIFEGKNCTLIVN